MGAWQERIGVGLGQQLAQLGPLWRLGLRCGGWLIAGAMAAGAAWGGAPLMVAVGLTAAGGGGILGLAALVGTVLGSLALWGPLGALEQVAAALLCFCTRFVLRDLAVARSRWLGPVCAAGCAALLGTVALWAGGASPGGLLLVALRVLLAGLSAGAMARQGSAVGRLFTLGCLVLGGAVWTLPVGLRWGGLLAAWAAAAAALNRSPDDAGAVALAGGAAMALAAGEPWPLMLGLGALTARAAGQETLPLRAALYLLTALSVALLAAGPTPALELTLGTLLATLTPAGWLRGIRPMDARQRQLRLAAEGLRALERCAQQQQEDAPGDSAALFDRAAEQVCRVCSGFSVCWEQHSDRTIRALSHLPPSLLERHRLRREDLPPAFVELCRRPEAFAAALNHQLELRLCRRQGTARLAELRNLQTTHTAAIARLLETLARSADDASAAPCRYRAVMGAAAAARSGEVVSGDAGSYCQGPDGQVYLLVCDGMGTGAEAARLSHAAVDALSALLQAGAAPEDALSLLGGSYLLRGDGAFSTVDLAAVDLHSGQAVIYKWGAAPSYLLTGQGVKRVGTATVPPGWSADEALAAERVRLSLERGEVLVLLSDGAGGTETERLLGAYDGCAPRELADRVVRAAQARAATDDMTAAALCLERVQ